MAPTMAEPSTTRATAIATATATTTATALAMALATATPTVDEDEELSADSIEEEEEEEDTTEEEDNADATYTIGVCAMDKKARSKPMQEILARLPRKEFRVVVFGDDTILHADVAAWPRCDALIAFFSTGFPLAKAQAYVALRRPVVVNDVDLQHLLMDRRDVYRVLRENGIPTPRHVFMNRVDVGNHVDAGEDADVDADVDVDVNVSAAVDEDADVAVDASGRGLYRASTLVEHDDYVEVDGVRICKPFVEKPVDGEDHNIHIYYPMSAGGGCKKLFRKIGNRSSAFDPRCNRVRTAGSFIYEEFLSTQGIDVKVYTVGANYAHAEARKSPVLDGRVLRDADGKEVRYPVILSTKEKEIAFKVCRAFGQTICGFDILRVQDASYVCDVNGWSFVKNSEKYYEDCATLLEKYLTLSLARRPADGVDGVDAGAGVVAVDGGEDGFGMARFASTAFRMVDSDGNAAAGGELSDPAALVTEHEPPPGTAYQEEELRCVLAVIRHGDRTPKQKMKMSVCHPSFLQFYEDRTRECEEAAAAVDVAVDASVADGKKEGTPKDADRGKDKDTDKDKKKKKKEKDGPKKKDLKIKAVADLEQLLLVSKELIRLYDTRDRAFLAFLADREQRCGEDGADRIKGYRTLRDVLQRWQLCGINRKVQLKPQEFEDVVDPVEGDVDENQNQSQDQPQPRPPSTPRRVRASKLLLILKWGGDLTHSGMEQAEKLGQRIREKMYPGGDGGLIRLHSTYRHDLKIYTSDEGRVQKTAASFAKGLLQLEGDIIPILVGLVLKSKDADSMLDQSGSEAQEIIMRVKQRLHSIIHRGDSCDDLVDTSSSRLVRSVAKALLAVDQPVKKMELLHKGLGKLKDQLTRTMHEKAQVRAELAHKKNRQRRDPLVRVSRQDQHQQQQQQGPGQPAQSPVLQQAHSASCVTALLAEQGRYDGDDAVVIPNLLASASSSGHSSSNSSNSTNGESSSTSTSTSTSTSSSTSTTSTPSSTSTSTPTPTPTPSPSTVSTGRSERPSNVVLERSRSASATRLRYGLRVGGHMHSYSSAEEQALSQSPAEREQQEEEEALYPEPCGRETLEMMRERWAKLYRDFYSRKKETYDLSKIPDIHDCIRYDAIHNAHLHLTNIRELLDAAAELSHALVPQEYGINEGEKVHIGAAMCRTLLMKIKDDLDLARGLRIASTHRLNPTYAKNKHEIKSTHRSVRTRLYFTSESHLHTLLNVLRFGIDDHRPAATSGGAGAAGTSGGGEGEGEGEGPPRRLPPVGEEAYKWIEDIPELCYMTHFMVRVFERFQFAADDPQRFRLEIAFSPGATQDPLARGGNSTGAGPGHAKDVGAGAGAHTGDEYDYASRRRHPRNLDVEPLKIISREGLTAQALVDYFADVIAFAEQNNHGTASVAGSSRTSSPAPEGKGVAAQHERQQQQQQQQEPQEEEEEQQPGPSKRTGYLVSDASSSVSESEPEEVVL